MELYKTKSQYKKLDNNIFYYPSKNEKSETVIILKGIYGQHTKNGSSWENKIIRDNKKEYSFVCINTARNVGKYGKDAFLGKTFKQESADIKKSILLLKNKGYLNEYSIIGHSFGGTLSLSLGNILNNSKTLILSGSGCGKSSTTVKPILSTLPNEEVILKGVSGYLGKFGFIRGCNDTIIPKNSQDKIIKSATSSSCKIIENIKNADHNLNILDSDIGKADKIWNFFIKVNNS